MPAPHPHHRFVKLSHDNPFSGWFDIASNIIWQIGVHSSQSQPTAVCKKILSAPAQRPRAATCRRSPIGACPARKFRRSGRFRRLGRAVPGQSTGHTLAAAIRPPSVRLGPHVRERGLPGADEARLRDLRREDVPKGGRFRYEEGVGARLHPGK